MKKKAVKCWIFYFVNCIPEFNKTELTFTLGENPTYAKEFKEQRFWSEADANIHKYILIFELGLCE